MECTGLKKSVTKMWDAGTRSLMATTLPSRVILRTAACIAILAFVIYRRGKARATEADTRENTPENGDEKQV